MRRRHCLRHRSLVAGLLAVVMTGAVAGARTSPAHANTPPLEFRAVSPQRLFDTRPGTPAPGPKGFVAAGQQIDVPVLGRAGVPAEARAVVMNVTATTAAGPGFVTVWAAGRNRPLASNLNLDTADQTVPNLVVASIGGTGSLSFFSSGGAHLLADMTAAVVPYTKWHLPSALAGSMRSDPAVPSTRAPAKPTPVQKASSAPTVTSSCRSRGWPTPRSRCRPPR